jgi:hypothetical protein
MHTFVKSTNVYFECTISTEFSYKIIRTKLPITTKTNTIDKCIKEPLSGSLKNTKNNNRLWIKNMTIQPRIRRWSWLRDIVARKLSLNPFLVEPNLCIHTGSVGRTTIRAKGQNGRHVAVAVQSAPNVALQSKLKLDTRIFRPKISANYRTNTAIGR